MSAPCSAHTYACAHACQRTPMHVCPCIAEHSPAKAVQNSSGLSSPVPSASALTKVSLIFASTSLLTLSLLRLGSGVTLSPRTPSYRRVRQVIHTHVCVCVCHWPLSCRHGSTLSLAKCLAYKTVITPSCSHAEHSTLLHLCSLVARILNGNE